MPRLAGSPHRADLSPARPFYQGGRGDSCSLPRGSAQGRQRGTVLLHKIRSIKNRGLPRISTLIGEFDSHNSRIFQSPVSGARTVLGGVCLEAVEDSVRQRQVAGSFRNHDRGCQLEHIRAA